jgi:hypothetical protein
MPQSKRRRSRVMPWLRVAAYLAVVNALALCLVARSVSASIDQRALAAGHELERLRDFIDRPTLVRLNGQDMVISSVTVPAPVSEVLDRFAADCDAKSGGLARDIRALPERARSVLPASYAAHFGVLRAMSSDEEGASACIAQGDEGGLRAFADHAKTFVATGDASGFGRLQYVFARRTAAGSHVVIVWSTGPIRPLAMFPDEGDAPGNDGPDGVRPPSAVRLVSASAADAPYFLGIYQSAESGPNVLSHYDATMAAHGWTAQPIYAQPGAAAPSSSSGPSRAYTKGGAATILYTEVQGPRTLVALVEMGTRGGVTAASDGAP